MFEIKMFCPGGKRMLQMPAIPRVGDIIYFEETGGLGEMGPDGDSVTLIVTLVSWEGGEIARTSGDAWKISITAEFGPN